MRRFLPVAVSLTALVGGTLALAPRSQGRRPDPVKANAAPIAFRDLKNRAYDQADLAKKKATVFFFSATQCPIAGKYTPRMNEIAKEYGARDVAFFLVNSGADDTIDEWSKYVAERKFAFAAVKDVKAQLADRLGATATPEAVVVDPAGNVRYIGRIDDNVDRSKVTRNDLRDALDSVLAGRAVKYPKTRAFGCGIFRETTAAPGNSAGAKVTFTRDIAPILNENCVVCHRAGDVAPFSLQSYESAKPWAKAIAQYTSRRLMPPWKAVPGHGEFADSRWLTDEQLGKISAWASSGAPMGDPKELPAPPKMHAPDQWSLGQPDLVVKPAKAYTLGAEGDDVYRNFTLPIDFDQDRYIEAYDFRPSNRAIVHHIIAYIDLTGKTAAAMDNKEANPGWSVAGGGSGLEDWDWGDGWAPGMNRYRLPDGIAGKIPKGAKLVLQVHYHKTGKPEVDQTEVAIYYAKKPVKQVLRVTPMGNPFFTLKADTADQKVKARVKLPAEVDLRYVLPHMHMLGKDMHAVATLPDGTKKSLILIQNWDFNWQMNYRYKEPMRLPKGTVIDLVATYDNTRTNPNQPSNPPKTVTYGEQTTDEMCFLFLGYTVPSENAPILNLGTGKGSL